MKTSSFRQKAVDASGYPNIDFEEWYQQGMACYRARFPRELIRQAFSHLVETWKARNKIVELWHMRAFVYGLSGRDDMGQRLRLVPDAFSWPTAPDASWQWVVCVYPDGICDVDLVHPVSRRFWSEDNGFIDVPTLDRWWFEDMGFKIMEMKPAMKVREGYPRSHLTTIEGA